MVSTATKRRRRERGNRVAAAIEDARIETLAERTTLGTTITPDVPDAKLFTLDRKGSSKTDVQQELNKQAAEQRRGSKRSRRGNQKVRRSEAALMRADAGVTKMKMGRKKKEVGNVDTKILEKRKFDKPKGHVGNVSERILLSKIHKDGKDDVWMGEMSRAVAQETGLNRKRLTEKMNAAHRKAASVIHPGSGLSINPIHEEHQDKLGEALAKILKKDDEDLWDREKMKYDPALLEESTEGEVGDTGMKVDANNENDQESEEEREFLAQKLVPERKTRARRNKEARKREMVGNIAKKRTHARRAKDFENIELIAEETRRLAEKISGEAKQRRLERKPAPYKRIDQPVLKKIAGQKVRNETDFEPVALSSELSETMRNVKVSAAHPMLRDRFLSFERRGLIEPPEVLPKEMWRMEQAKRQDLLRDKRKRKGRGSASNLTFWRNGKRAIK